VRYVVSVHSPNLVTTLRSRVALMALTGWALGRFDEVIAVNGRIAADLREAIPDLDVTVIPDLLPPRRRLPKSCPGGRAFPGVIRQDSRRLGLTDQLHA